MFWEVLEWVPNFPASQVHAESKNGVVWAQKLEQNLFFYI